MLNTKEWILYDFENKSGESIVDQLSVLLNAGVLGILVDPLNSGFSINQIIEVVSLCKGKTACFIVDDLALAKKVGASGLFFSSMAQADWSIKETNPELIIGGRANTLADSKNLELMDADFIVLDIAAAKPIEAGNGPILGAEIFSTIVPQQTVYGWTIASLNTPVLASGLHSLEELALIIENATIAGVLIADDFCPNLDRTTCLEAVVKFFKD